MFNWQIMPEVILLHLFGDEKLFYSIILFKVTIFPGQHQDIDKISSVSAKPLKSSFKKWPETCIDSHFCNNTKNYFAIKVPEWQGHDN